MVAPDQYLRHLPSTKIRGPGVVRKIQQSARLASTDNRFGRQPILRALAGGVQRVHVLDGRVPHATIAELFTDHGVGTLVTAE